MAACDTQLFATKVAQLVDEHSRNPDDLRVALSTIETYVKNIASHPEEKKYKRIRLTNAAFVRRVGRFQTARQALIALGFEVEGEFAVLHEQPPAADCESVLATLTRTIDGLSALADAAKKRERETEEALHEKSSKKRELQKDEEASKWERLSKLKRKNKTADNGAQLATWREAHRSLTKEECGFVGVRNQGATCYMSIALQLLYHLAPFREAVYNLPTPPDPPTDTTRWPLILALQQVLVDMQCGSEAVDPRVLFRSFGWENNDMFVQHDVLELLQVFSAAMGKLAGLEDTDDTGGPLAELVCGELMSYICATHVDENSFRYERFFDLSLAVRPTLEQSINEFLTEEILKGDNRWETTNHGRQDAAKGYALSRLPTVLQISLRRFTYNWETGNRIKVQSRCEFPVTLNMRPFLGASGRPAVKAELQTRGVVIDRTDSDTAFDDYVYELFAVLIHSGGALGGHYYIRLRPDIARFPERWLEFNDTTVRETTQHDSVEAVYGDDNSHTSAYMLVYIRSGDVGSVLGTQPTPPQSLLEYLSGCVREERVRASPPGKGDIPAPVAGVHAVCATRLINSGDSDDVADARVLGEFDWADVDSVSVPLTQSLAECGANLEAGEDTTAALLASLDSYAVWREVVNENTRGYAFQRVSSASLALPLNDLSRSGPWHFVLTPTESTLEDHNGLMFVALYQPTTLSVSVVAAVTMANGTLTPREIAERVLGDVKVESTTVHLVSHRNTQTWQRDVVTGPFDHVLPLHTGRTLVFTAAVEDDEPTTTTTTITNNDAHVGTGRYTCFADFMAEVDSVVDVTFEPRDGEAGLDTLCMSVRWVNHPRTVTHALATLLGVADTEVRLTGCDGGVPRSRPFLRFTDDTTMSQLLVAYYNTTFMPKLYYEIVEPPSFQYGEDGLLTLTVALYVGGRQECVEKVTAGPFAVLANVVLGGLKCVETRLTDTNSTIQHWRLLEVYGSRILRSVPLSEAVTTLNPSREFRVEEVSEEDVQRLAEGGREVFVVQYQSRRESVGLYVICVDTPFVITLCAGEGVDVVKERIATSCGTTLPPTAKICVIRKGMVAHEFTAESTDVLASVKEGDSLGVELMYTAGATAGVVGRGDPLPGVRIFTV